MCTDLLVTLPLLGIVLLNVVIVMVVSDDDGCSYGGAVAVAGGEYTSGRACM